MFETTYGEKCGIQAHGTDTILLCHDTDGDSTSVTMAPNDLHKLHVSITARIKVLEQQCLR